MSRVSSPMTIYWGEWTMSKTWDASPWNMSSEKRCHCGCLQHWKYLSQKHADRNNQKCTIKILLRMSPYSYQEFRAVWMILEKHRLCRPCERKTTWTTTMVTCSWDEKYWLYKSNWLSKLRTLVPPYSTSIIKHRPRCVYVSVTSCRLAVGGAVCGGSSGRA